MGGRNYSKQSLKQCRFLLYPWSSQAKYLAGHKRAMLSVWATFLCTPHNCVPKHRPASQGPSCQKLRGTAHIAFLIYATRERCSTILRSSRLTNKPPQGDHMLSSLWVQRTSPWKRKQNNQEEGVTNSNRLTKQHCVRQPLVLNEKIIGECMDFFLKICTAFDAWSKLLKQDVLAMLNYSYVFLKCVFFFYEV